MNWFFSNYSNFGGSFNGGVSTRGWGGNYGWGGNSGAVQGANNGWGGGYSGNTQTLSSLNTQPMDYRYGAIGMDNNTANNMSWGYGTGGQGSNPYVQFRPDAIGFGFNGGGNTGWGRPDESGRYYNYAKERQPYDDFLRRGFNPGYEQNNLVATRDRRRNVEQTIDSIGQVGFWGRGSGYPLSLYVG
jgi:hypothetical protein